MIVILNPRNIERNIEIHKAIIMIFLLSGSLMNEFFTYVLMCLKYRQGKFFFYFLLHLAKRFGFLCVRKTFNLFFTLLGFKSDLQIAIKLIADLKRFKYMHIKLCIELDKVNSSDNINAKKHY